jgi:hypothetical protein
MSKVTTGLEALLGASLAIEDTVYIPRLKTHFTVRALTSADFKSARQQATVGRDKSVDEALANRAVVVRGCVDPDFNDKALRDHYGAEDAADCVDKALLPGELTRVMQAIMSASGFGDEDEALEEAKN